MSELSKNHRRLSVLFLTFGEFASRRYRVVQFLPLLRDRGLDCDEMRLEKGFIARVRQLRRLDGYDAVVLQKHLLPPWQLRLLRRHSRRLIYDIDDAVMYHAAPRPPFSRTRRKRFGIQARAADIVSVGNDFLAETAREAGGRAVVIPTALDPAKYDAVPRNNGRLPDKLTLGWIGSSSTLHYLERLEPALRLIARRTSARLKVIANVFPAYDFIEVIKKPWREAEEAADVRSLDIGLSPLGDDVWSRGKCGLKTLQYYAARIPVVGSPHGVHAEMIRDEANGFTAATDDEWVDKVCRLAADPALRRRLGEAGRRSLDDRWTPRAALPNLEAAIRGEGLREIQP